MIHQNITDNWYTKQIEAKSLSMFLFADNFLKIFFLETPKSWTNQNPEHFLIVEKKTGRMVTLFILYGSLTGKYSYYNIYVNIDPYLKVVYTQVDTFKYSRNRFILTISFSRKY